VNKSSKFIDDGAVKLKTVVWKIMLTAGVGDTGVSDVGTGADGPHSGGMKETSDMMHDGKVSM